MSDTTSRLKLPLLQAAQAQKHVTLNESLVRLDGLVNLVLEEANRLAPPEVVVDGLCYGVAPGAVDAWAGQGGQIAIGSNGGWVYVAPRPGMSAWDRSTGARLVWAGSGGWIVGALTLAASGAGMVAGVAELEVTLTAGTSITTGLVIPSGAMVIGANARVKQTVTGTLTSWQLGTAGALDRFGKGLGLTVGSWARGILSAPMTYWDPAPLILTSTGGAFAGGKIRLAIHWWELRLPD
ncbi:DUF2793 domain-containing protein [Paracoccus suum]|uniref:DUF2793 domain-containing protein n=1 Tax=Paracoccus suum TaxID=2259340 RepID=A0A344PLA3_9RHOB|nr:DUF2793 domain-containing protein [Paracoccus suum]AXC50158.1 DUF2793 domain-containing protein [Paracoccus suum]